MTSVDVAADLTLSTPDGPVSISGYGSLVVVDAPSLRAVRRLYRTLPGRTTALLRRSDLTFDVRVRGRSVARLGPDIAPGVVASLAGVAPARISLGGLLLATIRARPPSPSPEST